MKTDEPTRTEQKLLLGLFAMMALVGVVSVFRFRADEFGLVTSAVQVAIGITGVVKIYSRHFKPGSHL